MARVRFIGPVPVIVPELGGRQISPDEIVDVPDARFEGYVCQPAVWQSVVEPKADLAPAAPAKKSAALPQKKEG